MKKDEKIKDSRKGWQKMKMEMLKKGQGIHFEEDKLN